MPPVCKCVECGDWFWRDEVGSRTNCDKCLQGLEEKWRAIYGTSTPEEVRQAVQVTRERYAKYLVRSHRRASYYLRFALLGWSAAALIAIVNCFKH